MSLPDFAMAGVGGALIASGVRRALPRGTAATLEQRVRAFVAPSDAPRSRDKPAPALLVGALPFADEQRDLLFQPERVQAEWPAAEPRPCRCGGAAGDVALARSSLPTREGYRAMVRAALGKIEAGELVKVVLARRLRVQLARAPSPRQLFDRLSRDPSITAFLMDIAPASGIAGHTLIGATPELLVERRGLAVRSFPLAGSARRSADPGVDRDAAATLLASGKEHREHQLVVEMILDTLSPHCATLSAGAVDLTSTATMWHLGTPITGCLKSLEGPSAAGLAAMLHPTPAVGGVPRAAALRTIRELEGDRRDFYAGAIGWVDGAGDGEWHVTLRCAEIEGDTVTLFAGAGIVAGSDPEAELEETAAKFRAMLIALDLDEAVRQKVVSR